MPPEAHHAPPQHQQRSAPAAQTPPRRHHHQPATTSSSNKVSPSPDRSAALTHVSGHSDTGNSTSSTSLWLAQTDKKAPPSKSMSQSDHTNGSSYYEEEVVSTEDDDDEDGYYEEEFVGGAPPSERSMGSGNELDLFPEHVATIRFDEYDEMQTVLHINDYSKHEINRSWYKREDYDKMVKLARKTAEKAEERRKELEEIARQQKREKLGLAMPNEHRKEGRRPNSIASDDSPQRKDSVSQRTSGHRRGARSDRYGDDDSENAGDIANRGSTQQGDVGKVKSGEKEKKPIEYRGLEAWTASGAAKVKILKESAIELVWNEQSRQWDAGLFDSDAIRRVYVAVSQTAAAAAVERGKSDAAIVKRLQELEAMEKEKKRRRRLLGKSKALVKKSVKMTGRGVTQTGKLMRKTTKKTTKVAKEVTKRSVKAGVATATLDPRMMKEALKVSMKKRECKHETIVRPSNAHLQEETEKQHSGREIKDEATGEITPTNSFEEEHGDHYEGAEESSVEGESEGAAVPGKKKKSKLKLLGMVPIPGTKKVYKEDRREKKAEKRIQKQSRRPSWEAGVSTGKY
ncbi:MAG: hypothetical protein SGILL_008883 [Bacillariaceae sp.]